MTQSIASTSKYLQHRNPAPARLVGGWTAWSAFLVLVVLVAGDGRAATLAMPLSLNAAVAKSELIFVGTVTDVVFRDSAVADDQALVAPHTFVTYQVDKVLRGSYDAGEITLRFAGGYSPETGRVMVMPDGPLFAPGNRDVLLVEGNGSLFCPLTGCGAGRFRIFEGGVYANNGLALRQAAGSELSFGPDGLAEGAITMTIPPAPPKRIQALRRELATADGLDVEARRKLASRLKAMLEPRTLGLLHVSEDTAPAPRQPPMTPAELVALLRALSAAAPEPSGTVTSTNAAEPFRVAAPAATPAPRQGRPAAPRSQTREQRLLTLNGGNPVIPRTLVEDNTTEVTP